MATFETYEQLHARATEHPETFSEEDVYKLWDQENDEWYDPDDLPDMEQQIDEWFFENYGRASYMEDYEF